MPHSAESDPLVLAVRHNEWSEQKTKAIEKAMKSKTSSERTLFIEGSKSWHDSIQTQDYEFEPFSFALRLAKQMGWRIVYLDRRPAIQILKKIPQEPEYWGRKNWKNWRLTKYVLMNLREKDWARKTRKNKMGKNDVVVLHPDHVTGFLLETGIRPAAVTWLDKPKNPHRRLGKIGLYLLRRNRIRDRRRRIKGLRTKSNK